MGGKPADVITQALLQRQAFDRQRDIDAVNTGIGLSNVDDSSQNPANQPGVVDRIKQAYQRVTGQGVQATPAQIAGTRTELNQMAGRQAGANVNSLNASLYGTNGNGGAPAPVVASNGAPAGSYAPEGMQPTMRLPSGGTVQTAWTPYGQRMAEAKLSHDYMLAALGIKGDQRLQQIGEQGDNQANTANIRGQYQIGTTGMRVAQSNTNNVRSTGQSNINNLRTTSVLSANNANTVGADLTKHNTVSADALVQAASRGGLNRTVMQSRSHFPEAASADQALDQLGPTLAKRGGNGLLSNGVLGQVDPTAQRANQAGEQFVTLVGPMLNNGRMTQQDLDQVRKTYIPQVGDTPGVIKQKSLARKAALEAIQSQAKLGTVPTALSTPGASVIAPVQQPSTTPQHSALTPAQQARAASDPTYAAFLKTKGLM